MLKKYGFINFFFSFSQQSADKIMEASQLLETGKITWGIFINRMSYDENRICQNLDDLSTVDDARPENDNFDLFEEDEEQATQPASSQSSDGSVLTLQPCCVCLDQVSAVTLIPCAHLKVCANCWTRLLAEHDNKLAKFIDRNLDEEYRPKLKCPFCNVAVNNYLNRTYT